MAELICPVCAVALEPAGYTSRCPRCKGAWITEEAVVGILEERASTLVELPWQPRVGQHRSCAHCRREMETVNLGSVALDRCPQHGIWFDDNELTSLLKEAKQFVAKDDHPHERRHGLFSRLSKLF